MKTLNLKEGITWVGALDPNLRVFDIIMHTEFGTTYNSYVVEGTEHIALFETVKAKCFDEYIEKLRQTMDISKIEYIVVDHTEPDHVGSVEKMLELNPNIKIVGSSSAIKFLKEIVNRDFVAMPVKHGDTIDLGGKTLEFISAPFLHWPDSMYTYIKEDKALITCDSFGAHYSFDEILLSKVTAWDDYMSALKYYYNMIMGPFKPHVLSAIKKIQDKEIDIIMPGHGPVLDKNPWEIVEIYKDWSTEESIFEKKTVVIPYVSAYGYTETLAKSIAEGIKSEEGIDVYLHDMVYADKATVLGQMRWADGIMFGTPTINGDALPPIWDLALSMSPILHNKKLTAVFGSYGWSGEGVPNIEARLKMVRTKKFADGLKVNFKPSEDQETTAFNYGKEFAKTLLGTIEQPSFAKSVKTLKPVVESDGTVKKWICVVCNEVFEGAVPPEMCPTCGASQEQFQEYIDETDIFTSEDSMKIVIVGNGVAGLSAAKSARKRNAQAEILIISAEKEITYNRPMLSDYMMDDYDEKTFYLEDLKWYEENNVKLLLNTKVTKIDAKASTIITSGDDHIKYDKLILANGSKNFIPPITDMDKDGIYSLRGLEDVHKIMKHSENVKNAVVIGGGLLGLESAFALVQMGKKVTVIEISNHLAKRQLDDQTSEFLRKKLERAGVEIMTEEATGAFLGDGAVTGVSLCNGLKIDAELVIISAGIRSNLGICEGTDIKFNRGIIVNEKMETNVPNIYAAGDVAEFDSMVYGIWPASIEQGEIAGANAIGDSKTFEHFTPSTVFNAFDVEFFSIGDVGSSDDESYSTLILDDLKSGSYQKIVFKDDILVGGILLGDMKKTIKLMNGIKRGANKVEITKEFFL